MELSLRQALSYLSLTCSDPEEKIAEWKNRYALPARDRREGKEILRRMEEEIRAIPLPLTSAADRITKPRTSRSIKRIFLERAVRQHPRTERILSCFPGAEVQEITHYKDVFCRSVEGRQTLILAEKKGRLFYHGAPVCQDFGNRYFYYTSQVMNCFFDCDYCFLKGMYPSESVVVFVNLEDYFAELSALLQKHPVYLCLSYDTDLLALEAWTSFLREWKDFAGDHPSLSVEIRTKSAATTFFAEQAPSENLIFAYTLSPELIVRNYENGTPSLASRLEAASFAMKKGFPVRLCFDPVLYCENWEKVYGDFLDEVMELFDFGAVKDVSVGAFRIPHGYLRQMRKHDSKSLTAAYPYRNEDGVACYDEALEEKIRSFFFKKLTKKIGNERIFWWKSQENCDKVET